MVQVLLFVFVFMALPGMPELGRPPKPVERVRTMEETDVDSLVPVTGVLTPVRVAALEGMPRDAEERPAFVKGFLDIFREKDLARERLSRRTGAARAAGSMRNRFRLAEAHDTDEMITVRGRLDWYTPAPDTAGGAPDSLALAWPGLGVHVFLVLAWPESSGGRPNQEVEEWLAFPAGHLVDAFYYQNVGRQVALVLLEALHRSTGELDEDERLELEDTRRTGPPPGR